MRIGSHAFNLAEAVTAMVNNRTLSSVEFSEISFEGGTQAQGKSGAKVYTRLPVVNGVDLANTCPGGRTVWEVGTGETATDEQPTPTTPQEAPTPTANEPQVTSSPTASSTNASSVRCAFGTNHVWGYLLCGFFAMVTTSTTII